MYRYVYVYKCICINCYNLYVSTNINIREIIQYTLLYMHCILYLLHYIHTCFISISPDNVCSTSPLSALQILTVLSPDPDTTLLPSAEKATDVTSLVWPDKRYMSKKTNTSSTYASYKYLQTC